MYLVNMYVPMKLTFKFYVQRDKVTFDYYVITPIL